MFRVSIASFIQCRAQCSSNEVVEAGMRRFRVWCVIATLAAAWTMGFDASARAALKLDGRFAVQLTEIGYALVARGGGTMVGLGRFTVRENLREVRISTGAVQSLSYRGVALFIFAKDKLRATVSTSITYKTDVLPLSTGVRMRGTSVYTLTGGTARFADATGTINAAFTGTVTKGGANPPTSFQLSGTQTGKAGSGYHRHVKDWLARRYDTVYAGGVSPDGTLFGFGVGGRSFPAGRPPSGSAWYHSGGGMNPTISGPITCLHVMGDTAVIGYLVYDELGLLPGQEHTMQLVEHAGRSPDTVAVQWPIFGRQPPRSPSDCSPVKQPTYSSTVARGRLMAIFDADMVKHQECQSVEDANGGSVIRTRTMSCQSARAIALAVNNNLLPDDTFLYLDSSNAWSKPYSAPTPYGDFRCRRSTNTTRCNNGRLRLSWITPGS